MRVYVTGGGRGFVAGHVVRDPRALARTVAGCDAVCNVAALYSFTRAAAELEAVNVTGTANVLAACRSAGVTRIVHTSSCATCGPVAGRPAAEGDAPPAWELAVPYKRTKLAAERLALTAGAVCANPTTPVGEGDTAPTPTGAMVRGVASGRYRVALRSTGLNLVDVRDVARGLAVARLANAQEVALARLPAWFSSAKAERELGYVAGPVEPALARAVADALARDGAAFSGRACERADARPPSA